MPYACRRLYAHVLDHVLHLHIVCQMVCVPFSISPTPLLHLRLVQIDGQKRAARQRAARIRRVAFQLHIRESGLALRREPVYLVLLQSAAALAGAASRT